MDTPVTERLEVDAEWAKWHNAHERALQEAHCVNREEAQRITRGEAREEEDQRREAEKADANEKAIADLARNKEALSSQFTTGVRAIGDPDKVFGELITSGISPTALRKKVTDLETKLSNLEALKYQLVALGGRSE